MKNNDEEQSLIRRHLLGELTDEEQEQLEEHFISDPVFREKVLVIEDELIENYLTGELSVEEKERFVSHFLSTPQQVDKLKVARALHQYFTVEAAASPPSPRDGDADQVPDELAPARFLSIRNPRVAWAVAAMLLVAIFVGFWVLAGRRPLPEQLTQEQERVRGFQRELERLNNPRSPAQGTSPNPAASDAVALSLQLSPISLRGTGKLPEVALPTRAGIVQVSLMLPTDEYKSYSVVLQKSGEADRLTVAGLVSENAESGKAVLLKIPAAHLSRGDYLLELNGLKAEGQPEAVGGYSFRILN